jgi:PPOX class probable F420-dependent enzyme
MNRADIVQFLRKHRWAVEATVAADGGPQAAVIGIAVTDDLEIVFDTSKRSRKAENLRRTKRVALVVGWDDARTVQLEGMVDEIALGPDRDRLLAAYVAVFADGADRARDADITHFRIRPSWARWSDFTTDPATIEEMSF